MYGDLGHYPLEENGDAVKDAYDCREGWRNDCALNGTAAEESKHAVAADPGDGGYPPKLCLQAPPVNRPLKSMTKTLPQSG